MKSCILCGDRLEPFECQFHNVCALTENMRADVRPDIMPLSQEGGGVQMAIKRENPYIWVTWLTRLLVGEHSCEWSAWFKAQHEGSSWNKVPSTFDMATWQVEHTGLVGQIRTQLEKEGKTVFTENQNSFVLRGSVAALGGKPDLVATSGGTGTIIDAKTGKESPAHYVQVMVYMYAVPRVLRQYSGMSFDGKVVYKDHEVSVPSSAVSQAFIENLSNLIRRLSSETPARKVPNLAECGFCDITKADCPERVEGGRIEEGETTDF